MGNSTIKPFFLWSFKSLQILFFTLFFLGLSPWLSAQSKIWQDVVSDPKTTGERLIIPEKYRIVKLEMANLKELVHLAPMQYTDEARKSNIILELPMPNGKMEQFRVFESPIMENGLAKQFPDIKTYAGTSLDKGRSTIRFDITLAGFHAMVFSPNGIYLIDPYSRGNTEFYISYYKKDFTTNKGFSCEFKEEKPTLPTIDLDDIKRHDDHNNPSPAPIELGSGAGTRIGDCAIRTYRLALAATGEYTAFHGGTVAGALAAQVTTMNRVNGIYLMDFAIQMILVANNDVLIYTNAATDPYNNTSGVTMLSQNQTNINNLIGIANYDIGHVFSTGGGGIAGLGVVCGISKARGVTGLSAPIGDPFDVDYVAHEIGHQFKGNHSFNNSCGGNRVNSTAWEPGSGSTIMAYAGICAPNVQSNSDAYFHSGNLTEMHAFINGTGGTCASLPANTNSLPLITSSTSSQTIPKGTPIILESTASDADGNSSLTYGWDQMDKEITTQPPLSTATGGPSFRSLNPSANGIRYLPNLSAVVSNNMPTWEVLPTVGRTLNFRLVVRDNAVTGGCNDHVDIVLTVDGASGPVEVTMPNASDITLTALSSHTVTWNVVNTDKAPVSCATVDIFLSTDGGLTYPTTLASSVPNTGTANVILPNTVTTTARIMVKGTGRAFYDISNNNFSIKAPALTVNPVANQSVCAGSQTQAIAFSSPILGATFEWTVNTSIGLALSGKGDIASFIATVSSINPVVATITVTPTLGNVVGVSSTFTITVNPLPMGNIAFDESSATADNINDGTICAGNSILLKAPVGLSAYLWNTTAITQSITVTPSITTTYSVDLTNSFNCSNTLQFKVNVNPRVTPSVTINVSNNLECEGTPVTFTATPVNGGRNPVYTWHINNVAFNNVNSELLTLSNLKNNDVVRANLTSTSQCLSTNFVNSNTITMNIKALPFANIVADNPLICSGSDPSFTINATPNSDITYTVNNGLVKNLNSGNGIANLSFSGTVGNNTVKLLNISNPASGCMATLNLSPTVIQSTAILFNQKVSMDPSCNRGNDGKITVSASGGTGAITYSILPDIGTQNPQGTFNGLNAQVYTLTAKDNIGCSNSTIIELGEPPAISIIQSPESSSLCEGNQATFNAAATGFNMTVKWQKNGKDVTPPINYASGTPAFYTTETLVGADNGAMYRAVFQNNCDVVGIATNPATITLGTPSVGGTLTASRTQGCGPTSVSLSLSNINGTVTQWEMQNKCEGNWVPIGSPNMLSKNVFTPNNSACYRVAVANGSCPVDYSTVATITIDPPAVGGRVTLQNNEGISAVAICPGEFVVLIPKNQVGVIGKWQYSFSTSPIWYDLPGTEGLTSLAVDNTYPSSPVSKTVFFRTAIYTELELCTGLASISYSSAFKVVQRTTCSIPNGANLFNDNTDNAFLLAKAYPNPATHSLYIDFNQDTEGVTQIEIVDITGRIVQRIVQNFQQGFNNVVVDMQNLSKGLYFVKIKDSFQHEEVFKISKF